MEDQNDQVTQEVKKSNSPNVLLIILIVGALLVGMWFAVNGNGKKKEPNYALTAQAASQIFIRENYFSDADFPTQKYDIVSQGHRYDVKGKFSHNGVVYKFECIGEFPAASTDEFDIEYLSLNNEIVFDVVGK